MLGLALDSSAKTASAALCATSTSLTLLGCLALPPERGKADQLILVVEKLLDDADVGYRDLEFIAVNRGPGSFTGIRSAVALGEGWHLPPDARSSASRPTKHWRRASGLTMSQVHAVGRTD